LNEDFLSVCSHPSLSTSYWPRNLFEVGSNFEAWVEGGNFEQGAGPDDLQRFLPT